MEVGRLVVRSHPLPGALELVGRLGLKTGSEYVPRPIWSMRDAPEPVKVDSLEGLLPAGALYQQPLSEGSSRRRDTAVSGAT